MTYRILSEASLEGVRSLFSASLPKGRSILAYTSIALGLSACGEEYVDSSAIRTEGMYAEMLALAAGDGDTRIEVELRVGGDDGTIVTLVDGDELIATADDEDDKLTKSGKRYVAGLGVDDGGTRITVALNRTEADTDAPNSRATLPEKFELELDGEETAIQRGQEVRVTWEPALDGESIRWFVEGDCVFDDSGSTADDGVFTFGEDAIRPSFDGDSCRVDLVFERMNTGSVDGAFEEGGRFRAIQRRTVSITSLPGPGEVDDLDEEETSDEDVSDEDAAEFDAGTGDAG